MISGNKILAIIPARGGSKGLPGKNVRPLKGKPLIAWTIELALKSSFIDEVIVSTDDNDIADIAINYGAKVPFIRPAELATDGASSFDTVYHCINAIEEKFDIVVLLQPTSPLRTIDTVHKCLALCANKKQTVISVSESMKPIEWMFFRDSEHIRYATSEEPRPTRRQDCKPVYYVDGLVYCIPLQTLLEKPVLFDDTALSVISSTSESVDIDTLKDFTYCEFLLKDT